MVQQADRGPYGGSDTDVHPRATASLETSLAVSRAEGAGESPSAGLGRVASPGTQGPHETQCSWGGPLSLGRAPEHYVWEEHQGGPTQHAGTHGI